MGSLGPNKKETDKRFNKISGITSQDEIELENITQKKGSKKYRYIR